MEGGRLYRVGKGNGVREAIPGRQRRMERQFAYVRIT